MREIGTHNNENDLNKYVVWCLDWIHRQPNRNWVHDDYLDMFEEERESFDQELEQLLTDYVGTGRMPPSLDGSRTFYRLRTMASPEFASEFTWGAWLDEDQDLTFSWPVEDRDNDPRIPIGYGGDKLISSTLLQTSAILKHCYSDLPEPVVIDVASVIQGDRKVYVGYAPACEIDAISSVPNMDPMLSSEDFASLLYTGNMSDDEWQRVVDVNRIRAIEQFINDPGNYIFNPILLYVDRNEFDEGCVREKVKLNGKGQLEINFEFLKERTEGWVDFIPKPDSGDRRPVKIVDGQHRVRGLAMSERGHLLNMPFVLIVGDDPDIDRALIAKIFTEINTKSVPLDGLHKLYLSYKFGMTGFGPSEDFSVDSETGESTLSGRPQRRAYELAMLLASVPDSPLKDMIEFQRPAIKGRRRPYHICVNAVNWVGYVRKWFIRGHIYADLNSEDFYKDEAMNFFKAFQKVSTDAWPKEPRWNTGRGRGKPLLQFEGPFLSLLELYPMVVSEIIEGAKVERPISRDVFFNVLKPLMNVDWLAPAVLRSPLKGRTNTNIRHLVKWMITAIKNGEVHSTEEILSPEEQSIPGKGILAVPRQVEIGFLSGVRWPGAVSCSMRITHPPHTLNSSWNVRWITKNGPREFDAHNEKDAVKSDSTQSQLTITMDMVPPEATGIEIESRLYNGIGSTITKRETLPRPE